MFSVRKTIFAFVAVCSFAVFTAGHGTAQEKSIVVASTTSAVASGLFDYLLPLFTQTTGIAVKVLALGTGQALDAGRRDEADVVFVHAKIAELQFVAEGEGVKRFPVMYNDFVLIGPKSDPARIKGMDVAKAFRAIKDKQAPFISRGDRSGTHLAELALWKKDAGIDIEKQQGPWYKSVGLGMNETLDVAVADKAMCCPTVARGSTSRTRVTCKSWWKTTGGCSTSMASCW
jgi:tungstate transport system substrate-binding protein